MPDDEIDPALVEGGETPVPTWPCPQGPHFMNPPDPGILEHFGTQGFVPPVYVCSNDECAFFVYAAEIQPDGSFIPTGAIRRRRDMYDVPAIPDQE
jgi:hypothetical protein